MMTELDDKIAALAAKYRPLAREILAEAVRIPADHVESDPSCGLSNHEGPRLEYLKAAIVEHGAVAHADDVGFDDFGNLVWTVKDADDGVPDAARRVIFFDGHSDTVKALRDQWVAKTGGGLDAYDGLVDEGAVDEEFLRRELGWLPPRDEWEHVLFGRGSADQLGGVISEIIATKILLELKGDGALRGVTVRAYATVAEEDNDGGGPMHVMADVLPKQPDLIPDVVVLTEGTGDATKGALGIYRGQRGRMQIEVEVVGRSCHGSMPWEGLNPLEYGAAILVEATKQYEDGDGFADHAFLGAGTRTASWATLDSPSDCAVPDRFTFRFDRRLTAGESPAAAVEAIASLPAVARAREGGLTVDVRVPHYDQPTWKGFVPGNEQTYLGWETPAAHPAIEAAADAYRRVVTPQVDEDGSGGQLRKEPRVDRWIFSTDGVGFPVPEDGALQVPERKRWVSNGAGYMHPPMFGVGPGIEQNTHKIGEAVDLRELQHAVAVLARFPSLYAERGDG
jgi:putative selenium metabolism hydrolase